MDAVVTCLDRTWGAHLGKAGMNFQKARVKHVNRIPRKYCDLDPKDAEFQKKQALVAMELVEDVQCIASAGPQRA